jgi:hypothetical protein
MHMPGFNAEQSLSGIYGRYRVTVGLTETSSKLTVTPQRIKLKTVQCDCDPVTDNCVCSDGTVINAVTGLLDLRF